MTEVRLGLRANWRPFTLLVALTALVGAMVGLERSVLPQEDRRRERGRESATESPAAWRGQSS